MRLYAKVVYRPRMTSGQFMDAKITPGSIAAVQAWCQTVYDGSQALVPVDTGELKESGEIVIDDSGKTVTGRVRYTSDHAEFNEFGTGQRGAASAGAGAGPYDENWPGMPATPFLRPPYDEIKPATLSLFGGVLATQLKT